MKCRIRPDRPAPKRAGFTLVELLVVITILGVLMSLLLPAVNSVRESMRRAQCKNNLAQLGRAAQSHLAAQGHFPSSGWGYMWTGDPDYGFGARQPGGWIYNSLPYLGLDMIHDIGRCIPDAGPGGSTSPTQNKYYALGENKSAALSLLICATRRKPIAYPAYPETTFNAVQPATLCKTDYAANGGSNPCVGDGPPYVSTFSGSCHALFPNCNWTYDGYPDYADSWLDANFNGVSGARSEVRQIPDGQSNVFFAGEKYLDPDHYYTGTDAGDDQSAVGMGNDYDIDRWVSSVPIRDTRGDLPGHPFRQRAPRGIELRFLRRPRATIELPGRFFHVPEPGGPQRRHVLG